MSHLDHPRRGRRRCRPGRGRGHGRRPPNGPGPAFTHVPGRDHAAGGPGARGFTGGGWGTFYRLVLPLRGRRKRLFFNQISERGIVAAGLAGAILGYAALGGPGAVLGLGCAVAWCERAMVRGRYLRR